MSTHVADSAVVETSKGSVDDDTTSTKTIEEQQAVGTSKTSLALYDDLERKLGISEYMSPDAKGFSAVVKARYSDFIVREVREDGVIAKLTSRDIPKDMNTPTENEAKAEAGPSESIIENKTTTTSHDDWTALTSHLAGMIKGDATCAENVITMLQAHNAKQDIDKKFVTLPSLDKAERKSIHNWIRESLSPYARADTVDGRIRIWHIRFEKEMPNYENFSKDRKRQGNDSRNQPNNKRNKKSWPEGRPEFLQFVLYKENIDTTTATKELSRKGSKARIGYAGMKDKRGVTAQFCTMQHTEPQQILGSHQVGGGNSKLRGGAVVQIGNFEYVSKEMRLGTLKGNRFDLVLRNVLTGTPDEEVNQELLQNASDSMKKLGFINYFGMQRFGKYQDTHLTGIAVLKGDFQKAIDIFMSPKPDDRQDVQRGRLEWQNRFKDGETDDNEATAAKRIIKCLNRFMTAENSAMQSLSRFPRNYARAFRCIPKTLRMMFLHAVQSLIWNLAASRRIRLSKTELLAGDLVMINEDGTTKPHTVTEADKKFNRFTIEDVVLPLIGVKSVFPGNEVGDVMNDILVDLGISITSFKEVSKADKDLAVNGDYRKLLVRPRDVTFDIKEYFDPHQPLLETDLMTLNGESITITPPEEGQNKKTAIIVGFSLPSSSYATVALRELMKKPTSSEYQKDLKLE